MDTVPCILAAMLIVGTLFQLFGFQAIEIRQGILKITTVLFGRRLTVAYELNRMKQFCLSEKVVRHKAARRVYRRIEFDYGGKKVVTKFNLSRSEGELLYKLIAPFVPDNVPLGARITNEPHDRIPNW
jgi:hypothetical protein